MLETKVPLGDLLKSRTIEVVTGFPFGGHNSMNSGLPQMRPFNVRTDGEIDLKQIKSIPDEAVSGKPTLQFGDILFNNTNTKELVGKCALWERNESYVFSNHMTRVRVTDETVSPAYLSFAILHHWMIGRSEMLARAHVAQASIIGERFCEIQIPWQDRNDQDRVSAVLSAVQKARRLQDAQIESTETLKRMAMRELFARGLYGEGQKESAVGRIPQSWSLVELGTLGHVGNGSTPKRSIHGYWKDGHYPWLTSAKVYERTITSADEFVTTEALKACHLPRVSAGSLLIAITGQGKTLGHCAVLGFEATVNQHLAYVALNPAETNPAFVRGYIETQYEYLRRVGSGGGSTKGALTCAFLRSLQVPMPPTLTEQNEIAEILDALDRKIDLHNRKKACLESLFRTLLHKLMTGEMRVGDLNLSAPRPETAAEVSA